VKSYSTTEHANVQQESAPMSIRKILVATGSLLICSPGAQAQSTAGEEARVVSVMRAVASEWNEGHTPSSAHFDSSLTVVDDTPPYIFQGPNAIADWITAYRESQPKQSKDPKTSLRLLEPKTFEINNAHAYLALPAEWSLRLNGQTTISHGVITATLDRQNEDWRIHTWIWTPSDR
jgi:hypothetical protein